MSINFLLGVNSFTQRKALCDKGFNFLAEGSHRIVYDLQDGTVLKLAKNYGGILQNKVEQRASAKFNFVAPVVYSEKDGFFIVVKKANKVTEDTFLQITGIKFEQYKKIIELNEIIRNKATAYNQIKHSVLLSKQESELKNNIFLKQIYAFIKDYGGCIGDLKRLSSYGIIENKVCPIDYGIFHCYGQEEYNQTYKKELL
jgi:hypothetical protein